MDHHTPRGGLGRLLLRWAAEAAGIALAAGLLHYLKIEVEGGGRTGRRGGGVPTDADIPENTPAISEPEEAEPFPAWNPGVLE